MTLDQFATAMVALGALSAVAAIRAGNPTAMALLASAIVSSLYCELVEAGLVTHWPAVLVGLDLLVIVWIVVGWANAVAQRRYGRRRDVVIIALFPLAVWPLYAVNEAWSSDAIDLIVAAQMLLSFPFRTLWAKACERWQGLPDNGGGPLEFAWGHVRT